jgi:hypothetical protein
LAAEWNSCCGIFNAEPGFGLQIRTVYVASGNREMSKSSDHGGIVYAIRWRCNAKCYTMAVRQCRERRAKQGIAQYATTTKKCFDWSRL